MRRPRHQRISVEDANKIIRDYTCRSDREAAIIAGADVEDRLGAAIKARFVDLPERGDASKMLTHASLFEGYGPLASFYAKIDIGFALGIYGKPSRSDLHIIRSIRNDFAHTIDPIKFSDDLVASKIEKIQTYKERTESDSVFAELVERAPNAIPRFRYLMLCANFSGRLDALSCLKLDIKPLRR